MTDSRWIDPMTKSPNADPLPPPAQIISVRGPVTVFPAAPEELKVAAAAHNAEIEATADRFARLVSDAFDRFQSESKHMEDDHYDDDLPAFEDAVRGILRVDRQTCADALMQMAGFHQASGDAEMARGLILAAQTVAPRPL